MAASGVGSVSSGAPETENCSDIRLLLSALVDNEATPEEAARAKTHITICANCASHFAFLRLTGQALRQAPEAFPPVSLSARIAAATYDRPTLAERITGWLRPAPVRVGLGSALAAGLALAFIVPRISEDRVVTLPSAPEDGISAPAGKPTKETTKSATAKSVAKPKSASAAPAPKPETAESVKLPEAKPPTVTVAAPPSVLPSAKPAPILVAKATPRKGRKSFDAAGFAPLSANDIFQNVRTESQMDRSVIRRSAGNITLKNPAMGDATLHRSGFNRAAYAEPMVKPRESTAASVAAVSPAAASAISPLLSDSGSGKLAEPPNGGVGRVASRLPAASATGLIAASAATRSGNLLVRISSTKKSTAEFFTFGGLNGVGGRPSSTGHDSGFGSSQNTRTPLVDAPVTGLN